LEGGGSQNGKLKKKSKMQFGGGEGWKGVVTLVSKLS